MHRFAIVSATALAEPEFMTKAPLGRSISALRAAGFGFETAISYGNTAGLSAVYNRAIERFGKSPVDAMILVHDDVYLNDLFMFEKLEAGFEEYDLIGIAGATALSLTTPNVGWCGLGPEYRAGGVIHPVVDRQDGAFYHVCYGTMPRKCLVVDGVFMAMRLAGIGDVRFDEQFQFDFYDMDFCLGLHNAGRRAGVLPILVTHLSLGASFSGGRFRQAQDVFVAKHMGRAACGADKVRLRRRCAGTPGLRRLVGSGRPDFVVA